MSKEEKAKITTKTKVISSIDTFQTRDKESNRAIQIERQDGLTKRIVVEGMITSLWSPNHKGIIDKLSGTEKEIKRMYKVATVIDDKAMNMNRIDIHTDIEIEFNLIDKRLELLFMCVTEGMKGNRKTWENLDTLEREAYWYGSQHLEVNFYNKGKECADKETVSEYPTRLEVRFKKIKGQDKKKHIEKAMELYEGALERFKYMEQSRIDVLCKEWDRFKEDNPKATFTHFVVANEGLIYTRNILNGIYKHVGLKGSVASWIKKFRQGYKLELSTEKELKDMVKRITISLKKYKNN